MKPYFADELVTLYCGRFEDVLPALDVTPDLVLADPPYGETSLGWDTWPGGWPALMPGRSMWCFGSMRMFLDQRGEFADWKLSQDVVWEKHKGTSFTRDRFQRVHEHALHWYRGAWSDTYKETPRVPYCGPDSRHGYTPARHSGTGPGGIHTGDLKAVHRWVDDGTRLMRSVIEARSMWRRGAIHSTEKPLEILTPLIQYGCPLGGLVLDPMAGSCSTLVAARASGRRAVGIELREEQCAKAVEWRLSQDVLPFGEVS